MKMCIILKGYLSQETAGRATPARRMSYIWQGSPYTKNSADGITH